MPICCAGMIGFAAQRLMELEVLRASGATQWLPRPISETRAGALELRIPTFPNGKLIACGRALILAQTNQRRSA